jgi:hypothetical protein
MVSLGVAVAAAVRVNVVLAEPPARPATTTWYPPGPRFGALNEKVMLPLPSAGAEFTCSPLKSSWIVSLGIKLHVLRDRERQRNMSVGIGGPRIHGRTIDEYLHGVTALKPEAVAVTDAPTGPPAGASDSRNLVQRPSRLRRPGRATGVR